jgi:hypothetical protein
MFIRQISNSQIQGSLHIWSRPLMFPTSLSLRETRNTQASHRNLELPSIIFSIVMLGPYYSKQIGVDIRQHTSTFTFTNTPKC